MVNIKITSNNSYDLERALSGMTEFALFMAKESGVSDRVDYIWNILSENNIKFKVEGENLA